MAQSNLNSGPPPVMTWSKASLFIAIAVIFDLVRTFFLGFVFFGPALLAGACTYETAGYVGTKVAALACTAGTTAIVVGGNILTAGALTATLAFFGQVMGMSVGFSGWIVLGILLLLLNRRIFVTNASAALTSLVGLGITQIPFIDFIPALTGTTLRLFSVQIRSERAALTEWKKKESARINAQQQQQQLLLLQQRAQEEALLAEQEEEEIPDEWPTAA
jgi:hypothetical protein